MSSKSASIKAFAAFTAFFAVCAAYVFWGAWGMDAAFVQPDNPTHYPLDEVSRWWSSVLSGGRLIPSDLMHVLGGMYFWQELQYALGAYFAALGMAFYLRGRGLGLLASYGAGAAYAFMGYNFTLYSAGHLGWFLWLMYGPFAFGLVDRCVRGGPLRLWAALGAALAWASAQQPDLWLMFSAFTFAYGVWCCFRERRFLKVLPGAALAFGVMLVVGAPQFRKALVEDAAARESQMVEASKSEDERWRFCTNWSLPPEDTLEFAVPDIHGRSNDERVSPDDLYSGRLGYRIKLCPKCGEEVQRPLPGGRYMHYKKAGQSRRPESCGFVVTEESYSKMADGWHPLRQHGLYMGFGTLLFAILGALSLGRRKPEGDKTSIEAAKPGNRGEILFWLVSGAVIYLCALGSFTPFYRLVYALPYMDAIRCPVKFVHLLEWCVAALAGFGIDATLKRLGARARSRAYMAIAAVVALNIVHLVCVDRGYFALDGSVKFFLAPNDAASAVVSRGGGAVRVAAKPHMGGDMLRDSLDTHLAEAPPAWILSSAGYAEAEAPAGGWRFHLVDGQDMRGTVPSGKVVIDVAQALKGGRLKAVGGYAVSLEGIRSVPPKKAQFFLLEDTAVPPPDPASPEPESSPRALAQAMTLASVIAGVAVLVSLICPYLTTGERFCIIFRKVSGMRG